ncbi:MAG TPA: PhoH family protein [Thermoanaerobaculia bacterium]|nr:PhoH family protein [Thermoanaerobaculia bacterium]
MSLTLSGEEATTLFGIHDQNLRAIEDAFKVKVSTRNGEIFVQGEGPGVATAEKLLGQLVQLMESGFPMKKHDIMTAIRVLHDNPEANIVDFFSDTSLSPSVKKVATPRNAAQKLYMQAIQDYDMTFGIGPAGTGKTFLAVAMAANALAEKSIKRIILCRPAVEAGEKLGFLPGDLLEKINPYLRPLYDSLYDLLGFEKVGKMLEKTVIEIAPLAFMRGRTLSDAFIILDEAQNTTPEQMKMFLTRLGFGSKAVITGDVTQIDLPEGKRSGLKDAFDTLKDVQGVKFFHFSEKDVVRHPLVGKIVHAYDKRDHTGRP